MLSEELEGISLALYNGEPEREIINYFLSKEEEIGFIKEVCLDSRSGLNPEIVNRILENHVSLQQNKGFIYIPSINLYVAKERSHLNKDWFECHKLLQANGERMLILPEFIEFLKYAKINLPEIYKKITGLGETWRAEWLDADFEVKKGKLCINYNHILDSSGNLIPHNSEPLDRDTLMKDKRISLDDYLNNNHTSQGLLSKKIKSGDSYYWYPRNDNNSVARFYAGSDGTSLGCLRSPSYQDSVLGVRAVRHA